MPMSFSDFCEESKTSDFCDSAFIPEEESQQTHIIQVGSDLQLAPTAMNLISSLVEPINMPPQQINNRRPDEMNTEVPSTFMTSATENDRREFAAARVRADFAQTLGRSSMDRLNASPHPPTTTQVSLLAGFPAIPTTGRGLTPLRYQDFRMYEPPRIDSHANPDRLSEMIDLTESEDDYSDVPPLISQEEHEREQAIRAAVRRLRPQMM